MRTKILLVCLASQFLFSACSKKEEPAPQAAAPAPAAPEAAKPDEAATASGAKPNVNVSKEIAKADTSLKQRDYEAAADSLLKAQYSGQPMTKSQTVDHYNKMRQLQQQIAEAMMHNDPKAKAAAELLRNTHR